MDALADAIVKIGGVSAEEQATLTLTLTLQLHPKPAYSILVYSILFHSRRSWPRRARRWYSPSTSNPNPDPDLTPTLTLTLTLTLILITDPIANPNPNPNQVFAEHDKVQQFEKILEIIKDKARSTL